ncbi:LAME_0H13168g1_1 [Lachancea meyersii CBS 8951]|uniref:LAME_0H13168g1_1 n=1 Tax=Lachancea meyersii CBS 8951 TaxID=1266667 RepID=A0A1G4KGV0_9SACH|nr:LAME_0H13168g1_1 [Lachancea meyersii CBS 8951]
MSKPKVLIPFKTHVDLAKHLADWNCLNADIDFIEYKITSKDDFKAYLKTSDIVCLWITDELCTFWDEPTCFFDDFPASLKLIAVPWVGTDFLDVSKLRSEKNITVCNIGPHAAGSVAEIALQLTLSCFRMTSFFEHCFRFVHTGQCLKCFDYVGGTKHAPHQTPALRGGASYLFPEPLSMEQSQDSQQNSAFTIAGKSINSTAGKTALILGFGYIGQTIGKKLHHGLDMSIRYYKRSGPVSSEILGYPAEYCDSLKDPKTWAAADLVVLALPGDASTSNIVNHETLSFCKDGVRIVNVGRGSCIDEEALLAALESGKVCSAGLDVYKNEGTKVDPRFFDRWDVTLLPHIGSAISEMISMQTSVTLNNIEDVLLKNGSGLYPVN